MATQCWRQAVAEVETEEESEKERQPILAMYSVVTAASSNFMGKQMNIDVNTLQLMEAAEADAVAKVNNLCRGSDCEINGCNLDEIVRGFLRDIGCHELADAHEQTPIWRA